MIVDPRELRAYCDDMRRPLSQTLVQCRWLAGKAVLLSYEELVADPNYWLKQQICPLLNVPFGGAGNATRQAKHTAVGRADRQLSRSCGLLHSPLCRQQHQWPWRETNRRAA